MRPTVPKAFVNSMFTIQAFGTIRKVSNYSTSINNNFASDFFASTSALTMPRT